MVSLLDDQKDLAEITEVEVLLLCSETTSPSSSKTTSHALRPRSHIKRLRTGKRRKQTPPTSDGGCMAPRVILLSSTQFYGTLKSAINSLHNALPIIFLTWILGVFAGLDARLLQPIVTPFCLITGSARAPLCVTTTVFGDKDPPWADFPSLVNLQCWKVDSLLEDSAAGSALASEIAKANSATKDLLDLIYVSDLDNSVALMSFSRDLFSRARRTSYGLHHLHDSVLRTLHSIREDNNRALRTIETATTKPTSSMASLYHWLWVNPFAVITQTFEEAIDLHIMQLNLVVTAAEKSFSDLQDLLARVDVMHEIFRTEGVALSSDKADLFADLWVLLGARRRNAESFDVNLLLLKGLVTHWDNARWHTRRTLDTLLSMQEDVARLMRDRTLTQKLGNGSIPVDLHIDSLRKGIKRLETSLTKVGIEVSDFQ